MILLFLLILPLITVDTLTPIGPDVGGDSISAAVCTPTVTLITIMIQLEYVHGKVMQRVGVFCCGRRTLICVAHSVTTMC